MNVKSALSAKLRTYIILLSEAQTPTSNKKKIPSFIWNFLLFQPEVNTNTLFDENLLVPVERFVFLTQGGDLVDWMQSFENTLFL